MPLTVLLDWSNYVYAKMEPVTEAFMASEAVNQAREMIAALNAQQHDPEVDFTHEKRQCEAKLRGLLMMSPHVKDFKASIVEALKDQHKLLQDPRTNPAAAIHTTEQLQSQGVKLVVVTEGGRKTRWKTQQLVVARAKELAVQLGVGQDEFEGLIDTEAAAGAAAAAALPSLDASLGPEQHDAEQLDAAVLFRVRGALLYIAKQAVERAIRPDTPLLVIGTTADEAIAAIAHHNAALPAPHPMCIKSDDSDFWQLSGYGVSHVSIKWEFQYTAAAMPANHLKKCAVLGKGKEDLTQFGSVFGPAPAGVEAEDAVGTKVHGAHRPGDAASRRSLWPLMLQRAASSPGSWMYLPCWSGCSSSSTRCHPFVPGSLSSWFTTTLTPTVNGVRCHLTSGSSAARQLSRCWLGSALVLLLLLLLAGVLVLLAGAWARRRVGRLFARNVEFRD